MSALSSAQPCWSNLSGTAQEDRGLFYGDGLFETILIADHRPRLLARHVERLSHGARVLGLQFDKTTRLHVAETVERALAESALAEGVLKVLLTRAAVNRGYWPDPRAASHVHVLLYPYSGSRAATAVGRRAVGLCHTRLSEQPALAGLKHTSRLEQVVARAEWHDPSIYEGLMLDASGGLVEATASNLFLLSGSQLLTPQLDRCGVAGVMRGWVLARAAALGMGVQVRPVELDELEGCDGLLLTNALTGVVAATDYLGPLEQPASGQRGSIEALQFSGRGEEFARHATALLAREHEQDSSDLHDLWLAGH